MSEEGSAEDFQAEVLRIDMKNLDDALDRLIESLSGFKARGRDMFTEDNSELWASLKSDLDFANFIVSGLMYSHGMIICSHDEEEDEDDDE